MNIHRRRFVGSAAGMAATTGVAADWLWPKHSVSYQRPRSFVAILSATEYSEKAEPLLMGGLRLFRLNVAGGGADQAKSGGGPGGSRKHEREHPRSGRPLFPSSGRRQGLYR